MTDVDVDKSAQLERRVRELEVENARLAAESDAADSDAAARPARGGADGGERSCPPCAS